ncbi:unnamed protein product [Hermetia illucens]|uniref:Cuticle protein n=1 Tax=Hermetia illucens TaxID=343691 RepID=A0A7R8YNI9_HERIL|nr:adult cuticle protein 1-like [Hermetia illucens]CAD7079321.1 unnamed protein product [Hermetia illucens]
MKFVIAVVMLALAAGAQSGYVPLPYLASPLSYTAVSGPGYYAAAPGAVAVHASPLVSAYSAPAITAYSAPVVAPAVVAAEGSYVAQNRGAVHVAPLPGHLNSAASVNLEPAPGTL